MIDFATFARSRRSIRRYTSEPIPRETLKAIVDVATWSPSAHNRQPWRFAVIDAQHHQENLARAMGHRLRADLTKDKVPSDIIKKDVQRSYERITGAAALICLCMSMEHMDTYPDEMRQLHERTMAIQSTAMAGQNLLLAAHDHGLGACWMCAPLFCPDTVQEALNLPPTWEPQALITLGYPAQERQKTRKLIDEVMLWLS